MQSYVTVTLRTYHSGHLRMHIHAGLILRLSLSYPGLADIYSHAMPCSPARFWVIVPKDIYWVATSPASCRMELPVTMARENLTLLCRCLAVIHKYVHVASSAEAGR